MNSNFWIMAALNLITRDVYNKLNGEIQVELPFAKTMVNTTKDEFITSSELRSYSSSRLLRDSSSDSEQESSTHLLQDLERKKPKCKTVECRLPSFRSPSIQHRPLGTPQPTISLSFHQMARKHWTCTLCIMTTVMSFCLAFAFYLVTECEPSKQWWQTASTYYEVFPSSFQDTDSDGFGDMKGLIRRLDYIQNLNVDAVRLNSIFSALDYPLEYEHVIDFANMDPHLGRIEDFREFVRELHSRGMRIILDINPTVTSDQHSWAAHWLLRRKGPFEHFYVNITDEEREEPPLEPSPEYSEDAFIPSQRTFGGHLYLNWSNPILQTEMKHILELWIAQGVDGFYFKHLKNLHVTDHGHIAQVIGQWREVLNTPNNSRKVLMMSQSDIEYLELMLDPVAFTFIIPAMVDLIDTSIGIRKPNSSEVYVAEDINRVKKFWSQFEFQPTTVWHLGTVETRRLASKIGSEMNLAGLFLLAILPGAFSVFYGDEIGLQDTFEQSTQKAYRGGQLVPMPWTSEEDANFTSLKKRAWLPLHPDCAAVNVESQSGKLDLFRRLSTLKRGGHSWLPSLVKQTLHRVLFLFSAPPPEYRIYQNHCGMVVVEIPQDSEILFANFGSESVKLSSNKCGGSEASFFSHFERLESSLATNNSLVGRRVEWRELLLKPGDSIIGPIITK